MTAQTGPDVVVIRAGVIGLSTAVCLAERGRHVEVRTELEPSQTTSAVASAMIGPAIAPPDSGVGRWEQASVAQFSSLAEERGTGVMMPRGWRRQAGGLSCALLDLAAEVPPAPERDLARREPRWLRGQAVANRDIA